ncbi:MAG: DUF5658 family protein [Bacillota bacterium]|nr:DUF5658 family protein [Bacillota bacterium]
MKAGLFLLFAGLLDALLTHLGISLGKISEMNPFMNIVIYKSWLLFYLVKILLPLILIGILYLRPLTGKTKVLLTSCCTLYLGILLYHLALIFYYLDLSNHFL